MGRKAMDLLALEKFQVILQLKINIINKKHSCQDCTFVVHRLAVCRKASFIFPVGLQPII